MRIIVNFLFFILTVSFCCGQNPVNAFAEVTAISGNSVLTVSSVNETFHTFEDGEFVIVMQMQDDVIGTNTTNAVTFGDLGSIQSAGLYEVALIFTHSEAAGLPDAITLVSPLMNSYNINPNARVQIISFRNLGTNFTTTGAITTFTWNGTIGGVTAISVASVLTVGHDISANFAGFSKGFKNTPNGYTGCEVTTYQTAIAQRYAGKAEGIYRNTNSAFTGARGKILNGGGGGNDVNGGGGGGGNYTDGGSGGSGWTPSGAGCSPIAGGLGGISLSGFISGSRIFMGGGGGGGHENDGVGTVGGNGGGILIIKAGTLTTISCAGISISATGSTAANAANDGAGGGGAGGTIIFNVGTFDVAGACPIVVTSNGGNGGGSNLGSGGAHSGGGGGGQGVVIYSGPQPTTNVTTSTTPGSGGLSCNGCGASVNGVAGGGPANSGIVINASGPLPIELVSFDAGLNKQNDVNLDWTTGIEKNAKEFVIQRMDVDGHVSEIANVSAKGSYSKYNYVDTQPGVGVNYYRLKQIDLDGQEYLKYWLEVDVNGEEKNILIYPNPLSEGESLMLAYEGKQPELKFEILDMSCIVVFMDVLKTKAGDVFKINAILKSGVYVLKVKAGGRYFFRKLVVN